MKLSNIVKMSYLIIIITGRPTYFNDNRLENCFGLKIGIFSYGDNFIRQPVLGIKLYTSTSGYTSSVFDFRLSSSR